ncbi:hypothetical protein [Achromobacter marplatensis]
MANLIYPIIATSAVAVAILAFFAWLVTRPSLLRLVHDWFVRPAFERRLAATQTQVVKPGFIPASNDTAVLMEYFFEHDHAASNVRNATVGGASWLIAAESRPYLRLSVVKKSEDPSAESNRFEGFGGGAAVHLH